MKLLECILASTLFYCADYRLITGLCAVLINEASLYYVDGEVILGVREEFFVFG